ncbi:MAG: lysophospholipid acyltransferase family protein [Aminipila sp.]
MRTIIWFIYFWLYLIMIYPNQKHFEKKRRMCQLQDEDLNKINGVVSRWAQRLLNLAGVSCKVQGLENIPKDTPVLFTANHQGYFDIPLMITGLDDVYPIIAKKGIAKLPFISNWMILFDCLFLDRNDARQSLRIFSEAEALIKRGKSVIIFPEGTRSRKDEPGEFKSGAFKIAIKTGVPIVPVAINGSYKAMEANHMWIHPAKTRVTILPPIDTKNLSKEEIKNLGVQVRESIFECNTLQNNGEIEKVKIG